MHSLPDEANPQEQNRRILMFSGVITTCQSLNGNLSTTEDLCIKSSHNLERYFKSENLRFSIHSSSTIHNKHSSWERTTRKKRKRSRLASKFQFQFIFTECLSVHVLQLCSQMQVVLFSLFKERPEKGIQAHCYDPLPWRKEKRCGGRKDKRTSWVHLAEDQGGSMGNEQLAEKGDSTDERYRMIL